MPSRFSGGLLVSAPFPLSLQWSLRGHINVIFLVQSFLRSDEASPFYPNTSTQTAMGSSPQAKEDVAPERPRPASGATLKLEMVHLRNVVFKQILWPFRNSETRARDRKSFGVE